jgi:hypothetical protein
VVVHTVVGAMAAGMAVDSVADIAAHTPAVDSVEVTEVEAQENMEEEVMEVAVMEVAVMEVAAMVVADGGGDSFNTSTSCSTFKGNTIIINSSSFNESIYFDYQFYNQQFKCTKFFLSFSNVSSTNKSHFFSNINDK